MNITWKRGLTRIVGLVTLPTALLLGGFAYFSFSIGAPIPALMLSAVTAIVLGVFLTVATWPRWIGPLVIISGAGLLSAEVAWFESALFRRTIAYLLLGVFGLVASYGVLRLMKWLYRGFIPASGSATRDAAPRREPTFTA